MYFYLMARFRGLLELFGGGMTRDGAERAGGSEEKETGVASMRTQQ